MASNGRTSRPQLRTLALALLTLLAFALRIQRIEWQPLWWDEGYSVFFATEPLARMIALTARDIHPPLYYALLHGWLGLLGNTGPAALRLFSAMTGVVAIPLIGALAGRLGMGSVSAAVSAALLLAVNPMHIYYSQEIRMYSLATSLGLASSLCTAAYVVRAREDVRAIGWLLALVAMTVLLIHTLYYAAILAAAQFVWAAWMLRHKRASLAGLIAGGVASLILALPWLGYSAPRLMDYIANKIQSDQDVPLRLTEYLLRHANAFVAGHVLPLAVPVPVGLVVGLAALVPLWLTTRNSPGVAAGFGSSLGLAAGVALPALAVAAAMFTGFVVNLRYPFFPTDGERLLLFSLPYFLILVALGLAFSRLQPPIRLAWVAPLLIVNLAGIAGFYTTPRHTDNDYREIVATVEQRGSENDSVLALFPWQVGYWRAYGRRGVDGALVTPQPEPVGQEILVWDDGLQRSVDSALDQGTMWFPEPLSLGSTLPSEVEEYLTRNALSVENRWQTASTRLTAWAKRPPSAGVAPDNIDYGPITLAGHVVGMASVPSDNSVIPVTLAWERAFPDSDLDVALKLVDADGRVWAERNYAEPGRFAPGKSASTTAMDVLGVQVPAGLPRGTYTLTLTVSDGAGSPIPVDSDGDGTMASSIPLREVEVTAPTNPVSVVRVPMDARLDRRPGAGDVEILGVSGAEDGATLMAGSDLEFEIVLRSLLQGAPQYELAVELSDNRGDAVSAWQGWPLPDYPTSEWEEGSIVRVPITLHVPAGAGDGAYALTAALAQSDGMTRLPAIELAAVSVAVRPANLKPPAPATPLPAPIQFGTHARLIGYDLVEEADTLELTLHWEVLQALLPQHHIFVHVTDGEGNLLAQHDGPPVTESGPAPTGSWRTGEYISTRHSIPLARGQSGGSSPTSVRLQVGLYEPESGVRLPAAIEGELIGDSAELELEP